MESHWRLLGLGFNGFCQLEPQQGESAGCETSPDITTAAPRVLLELPDEPSAVSVSSAWDSLYLSLSSGTASRSLCTGRWSDLVRKAETLLGEGDGVVEVVETKSGQLVLRTREKRVLVVVKGPSGQAEARECEDEAVKQVSKMRCMNDGRLYSLLAPGKVHECVFDPLCLHSLKLGHQLAVEGRRVVDIACGTDHCLLLTQSGELLSFGLGTRGQLGHGDLSPQTKPCLIQALAGVPVKAIACGLWHSLVLSRTGDMYSWGWNRDGQLGLRQSSVTTVALPSLVEVISGSCAGGDSVEVVSVSCGSRHSAAVTEAGELFCWGWGGWGQLGTPELCGGAEGSRAHSVYCCHWYTLYLQH